MSIVSLSYILDVETKYCLLSLSNGRATAAANSLPETAANSLRSREAAIDLSKKSHSGNRILKEVAWRQSTTQRLRYTALLCMSFDLFFLIFVYFLWNFAPIDSKYFVSHHVFLLHEVAVALVSSTYRVDMLVSVRVCMCASALVPRGRARASARV